MIEVDIEGDAISTDCGIIAKWRYFGLPFTKIHEFIIGTTLYQFLDANQTSRLFLPSLDLKNKRFLFILNR